MELEIDKLEAFTPSQLEEQIRLLIERDQSRLVQLLYRLDVDEDRIRTSLLAGAPEHASRIIAVLIIERLEQRARARKQFGQRNVDIPEDEKW